jgi:hypothetical protein
MQRKNITVRLFNLAGEVLGQLNLPAAFRLADLAALATLGAVRVEVLQ